MSRSVARRICGQACAKSIHAVCLFIKSTGVKVFLKMVCFQLCKMEDTMSSNIKELEASLQGDDLERNHETPAQEIARLKGAGQPGECSVDKEVSKLITIDLIYPTKALRGGHCSVVQETSSEYRVMKGTV